MQTGTVTLSDFILDRLTELELAAQVALATAPSEPIEGITPAGAVWFTPEQVLADVAAKRRIVERHGPMAADTGALHVCHDQLADDSDCVELRALAAVYADHPDYRQEWRP